MGDFQLRRDKRLHSSGNCCANARKLRTMSLVYFLLGSERIKMVTQ